MVFARHLEAQPNNSTLGVDRLPRASRVVEQESCGDSRGDGEHKSRSTACRCSAGGELDGRIVLPKRPQCLPVERVERRPSTPPLRASVSAQRLSSVQQSATIESAMLMEPRVLEPIN